MTAMKVVVICESMFGNTELLASAVAKGLTAEGAEVALLDVGDAYAGHPDLDCDLLVVAAPTHALTLSRPESRAQAVERGADPRRQAVGVREWLSTLAEALPPDGPRPPVAVFDSRVLQAKHWPGSAARGAERRLHKAGFRVLERASFYVDTVEGPLSEGEVERALAWGRQLAKPHT
ncbi:flavodoxin family protein [Marmoricola sp. RAF53]